jgi:hypothetical protein
MNDVVEFHASFQGNCFKSDEDGESKVTLTIPASYLGQYKNLLGLTKRDLLISVEEAQS